MTEVLDALLSDIIVLCYMQEEFYAHAHINHCRLPDVTLTHTLQAHEALHYELDAHTAMDIELVCRSRQAAFTQKAGVTKQMYEMLS
jgi:hypothetical protein